MPLLKKDTSKAEDTKTKANAKSKPAANVEANPDAGDGGDGGGEAGGTEGAAASTTAAASTSTAVAAAKPHAVALATTKLVPVLDGLLNAFKVEYNTLPRLQVNQGSYLLFDKNKKSLGSMVQFQLLSFQANWVISPGTDGDEGLEHVKYSDDGKITKDGRDCFEYLEDLKKEFPKASMKERCVLVVELLGSNGDEKGIEEEYNKLYQVDLAPSSKNKFDAYKAQTAFYCTRGSLTADQAVRIQSKVTTQTKGKLTWSVADFETLKE